MAWYWVVLFCIISFIGGNLVVILLAILDYKLAGILKFGSDRSNERG